MAYLGHIFPRYTTPFAHSNGVVIRTNSASTTLTIDDESEGTIYHYGVAGALNIIQCHTASYHENGNVAFAEIAKGRLVLENGSEIKHIHINANENANGFEEVIINDNGAEALPEAITRDQVDVSEAKIVVTVETGSTSETVYVYPYTDSESTKTGTTEQTITQNTTIATDLGKLVLDNGSDAGEKAMSNNEKTSTKGGLVEAAISEQIIDQGKKDGNNYVARYETTGYMSVGEAINAAATSGKVYILKDAVVDSSDFNKDITLVGNGQTLKFADPSENNTSDALNVFKVNGELTIDLNGRAIQGKSYINNTYYEPLIINNGKLTIKDSIGGGLLTTNSNNANAVVLLNLGDFVLESGTLGGPIPESTTFKCGTPIIVGSNSTTTINGGKIIGDSKAIGLYIAKQTSAATLYNSSFNSTFNNKIIINGGILTSRSAEVIDLSTRSKGANYCDETTNEIIINGGTFQHVNNDAGITYNSDSTKAIIAVQKGHANITINDGTFNASNGNVIEVLYESFHNSKFNIKGGNFTTSESKYILKVTKNTSAGDSPTDIVYNVDGGTFSQINNLLYTEEGLKANISGTYSSYIQ